AGLLGTTLDYKAWAPEVGQSFDLLNDEIPVATEERLWVGALEELKSLYGRLDVAFDKLEGLYRRLRERGVNLEKEMSGDAGRIADAVGRFVEELDALNGRWDN
ncbi:MAG: hypothetical protein GX842_07625, partial [Spirochaetales bacterium]|nr:hypothetical protein [Spirochaetales bacterium]